MVAERERGEDGRLLSGADAGGAIATGLTEKVELDRPTLADSTWQMDLMDMSTKQDTAGYAMLAVDVASTSMGSCSKKKPLRAWSRALVSMSVAARDSTWAVYSKIYDLGRDGALLRLITCHFFVGLGRGDLGNKSSKA